MEQPIKLEDDIKAWIFVNKNAGKDRIAIYSYGDHDKDRSLFLYMLHNIIPDGYDEPLIKVLEKELFPDLFKNDHRLKKPHNFIEMVSRFIHGTFEIPSTNKWKQHIKMIFDCLCIKITVNGYEYILADTQARSQFRRLHYLLHDSNEYRDWRIHHGVLHTFFLANNKEIDPTILTLSHKKLDDVIWAPGNARDFISVTYTNENMWNCLYPKDYKDRNYKTYGIYSRFDLMDIDDEIEDLEYESESEDLEDEDE